MINNIKLQNWQTHFFIFVLLSITIFYLQFTLLKPALEIGFKPDDWIIYFAYKTLGDNPLAKIVDVWRGHGAYTTYQVYYLGLLDNLAGFNYQSFQTINLIFKTLATLSLYPLIVLVFNRKLLAFLVTLLFGVSYSNIGPLEFAVKGSDYVAIFWMSLFLMTYYTVIKKEVAIFWWLALALIFLILTLTFSPIRLFPLLIIPLLIEVYLIIKSKNIVYLKRPLLRLLLLYSPFVLLTLYSPNMVLGYMQSPLGIYNKIAEGNWHLILSPFSGVGYTFIPNHYLLGRVFGLINTDSLDKYFYFLLGGPSVIFGFITLIVALLKSKKTLLFFSAVFVSNFILEILAYFVAFHHKFISLNPQMIYDPNGLYSVIIGIYIMVAAVAIFIEWLINKNQDDQLKALWAGAAFLIIFTFATWLFAPLGTGFSGTSYFLVVASFGTSLFMGAMLVSIYDAVRTLRIFISLKPFSILFIFLAIIAILLVNNAVIEDFFTSEKSQGRFAKDQMMIQSKFRQRLVNFDRSKPAFFYFDPAEISSEGIFYTESFLSDFPFWMHFRGNQLIDGCLEVLYFNEHKQLLSFIRQKDGKKGFFYRSLCVKNGQGGYKELLYTPDNFYAFKIKNRDFIDIRQAVLEELGF